MTKNAGRFRIRSSKKTGRRGGQGGASKKIFALSRGAFAEGGFCFTGVHFDQGVFDSKQTCIFIGGALGSGFTESAGD
jgi:hypothetical protein